MNNHYKSENRKNSRRLENAYKNEKPRFLAWLQFMGRSIEEAEDLVHDVYTELIERMPVISSIYNLPALINSLLKHRLIDFWRHEKIRNKAGKVHIAEEILREIIADTELNPFDEYFQDCLLDDLNEAIHALPEAQRLVIEAQVFGGLTFREIAEATGESIDTLTARKRYAIRNLSRALRYWIDK